MSCPSGSSKARPATASAIQTKSTGRREDQTTTLRGRQIQSPQRCQKAGCAETDKTTGTSHPAWRRRARWSAGRGVRWGAARGARMESKKVGRCADIGRECSALRATVVRVRREAQGGWWCSRFTGPSKACGWHTGLPRVGMSPGLCGLPWGRHVGLGASAAGSPGQSQDLGGAIYRVFSLYSTHRIGAACSDF